MKASDLRRALECGNSRCACHKANTTLTHCPAHDDSAPSLSVTDGDSAVLFKCFKGCTRDAIIEAIKARGLWEVTEKVTPFRQSNEPVAVYRYLDAEGNLVGEKGRFEGFTDGKRSKSFLWRLPGESRWGGLNGLGMENMPLYNLPDVLRTPDVPVFVCEGEKAVQALVTRGALAVCLAGGASQTRFGNALDVLQDRQVILWPDNDDPGKALMARLAGLLPHAMFISPPVPEKGDAHDYFEQGGTLEALGDLLRASTPTARVVGPDAVEVTMPHPTGRVVFTFTEMTWTSRSTDAVMEVDVRVTGVTPTPYHTRINLMSSSGREGIRRELEQVFGKATVDWSRMLSTACSLADATWKTIDLSLDLAHVEVGPRSWFLDQRIPENAVTIVFGMGGCVSGDTLIDGPDGPVRADQATGAPIRVWSLSPSGVVAAQASPTYIKGVERLYEVSLANGSRVRVTMNHRFLTPNGWTKTQQLRVGDAVSVPLEESAPALPPTSSGRGLSGLLAGGLHSTRTGAGSQERCSPCSHRCGQPPLSVSGNDRALAPSQGDAPGCTHTCSHSDGLACESGCNQVHSCGHQTRSSSSHAALSAGVAGFRYDASPPTLLSETTLSLLQSRSLSSAAMPVLESGQSEDREAGDLYAASEFLQFTSDSIVTAITDVGVAEFYDLTVPGYANYLANGMWHHNSMKSLLVLDMGIHALMDAQWAGMALAPLDGLLVVDYEDQPEEWRLRAEGICRANGWEFPEGRFWYLPGNAIPIHEQRERIKKLVTDHNIGLVIVDSASSASGGELLDTPTISKIVNFLQTLEATVIMTAHNTKAEDSNYPYGSIQWHNLVRATHYVETKQEEGSKTAYSTIHNRKANRGKQPPVGVRVEFPAHDDGPIRIMRDGTSISLTASITDVSLTTRIKEWLEFHPGPRTTREVAEAMAISDDYARRELNRRRDIFVQVGNDRPTRWGLLSKSHAEVASF